MPLQYLPDSDPTAPGVLSDVCEMVPTARGYKSIASDCTAGGVVWKPAYNAIIDTSAITASQFNAFFGMWNTTIDTGRIFVANSHRIYEFTDSGSAITLTDRSKGGANYTTTTTSSTNANDLDYSQNKWNFANYGDVVIAVNTLNTTQKSVTSGAFADLTGSPAARCVEVFKDFVFLGNCGNYGSVTGATDMLAWSGISDYTTWVPSASTQAGYVRFTDTPGGIKAVKKLGDSLMVYKRAAIYRGSYVGPPVIWAFEKISDKIGTIDQGSVCDIGNAHVFVGNDDIYIFDGTRPQSITTGIFDTIKTYLAANNPTTIYTPCAIGHDKADNLLTFYGLDIGTGTTLYYYNYRYNKWGKGETSNSGAISRNMVPYTGTVQSVGIPGTGNKTIANLFTAVVDGTNNDILNRLPANGYGNGTNGQYLTTGDFGRTQRTTHVKRVYPRFADDPSTLTLTPYYKTTSGGSWTTGSDVTGDTTNMRWDYLKSARWHKFKMKFTGYTEIVDAEITANDAGAE